MKRVVAFALIGFVVGIFIGLPMGVVGRGVQSGGEMIFGPIGAVIGALIALASRRHG